MPAFAAAISKDNFSHVSLDLLLLNAMRRFADEMRPKPLQWSRVLSADAQPETHPDRRRLQSLVAAVMPSVEGELASHTAPLLLTCPGLLASYNQLGLIERLRDNPGTAARWLLVASSAQEQRPTIDSKPVPVFSRAQCQNFSELS